MTGMADYRTLCVNIVARCYRFVSIAQRREGYVSVEEGREEEEEEEEEESGVVRGKEALGMGGVGMNL